MSPMLVSALAASLFLALAPAASLAQNKCAGSKLKAACKKASCKAVNCPLVARPSMVVTLLPSACTASIVHDFTATPSTRTVHAPHWLVSHPTLVPVRPTSGRK